MVHFLRYIWSTNKKLLLIILILFAAFFTIVLLGQADAINEFWGTYIDSFIGFITLAVALLVWHQESGENYQETLPKRLTVRFVDVQRNEEGEISREIMRCNKAILSHESDVRALAQQIGRQMVGRDLQLRPMLDMLTKEKSEENGERFMHYVVTIVLWKLLPNLQALLDNDRMLLWEPPHMEAPQEVDVEPSS